MDAYILIEIYKALAKTAKEVDGPPIESKIVTLDNRGMVLDDLDDDAGLFEDEDFYEKETQRRDKLANERVKVSSQAKSKHQKFDQSTYKKLVTNDGLTPEALKTMNGFIVDKNLSKLAKKL